MLRRLLARAIASRFIRHATLLSSGTLAANLITLVTLPLLTRLYPPDAFGVQALLILGSMALASLSTGYYDWAIPTPRLARHATALAMLALALSLLVALALAILLAAAGPRILTLPAFEALHGWLYVVPLLGFSLACYNVGNYWLLRRGAMAGLTSIRFVLPSVNAAVSLVLGSMGYAGGLVMGFVAGVILSGVFSMGLAMRGGLAVRIRHPLRRYVAMARTFRDFPLYGSIPATAMLVAGQIPLLVISQHHAISHAGYYVVVRSILYSGTLMIASACAQIILKHLAQVRHTHGAVWPYFIRMLALLAAAGLALGASFYLISPLFFRMFLGDAWATSASIARLMSLAMPFWLLGVGIAAAPIAMKILKPGAAWQLTYGAAACLQFAWYALPFMELVARIILFEVVAYAAYVAISVVTMYRHGRAWRESTQAKALQP